MLGATPPPPASSGSDVMTPSLAWLQQHCITFLPSLMPNIPSTGSKDSMRDETAESFQRDQIWRMSVNDLSLLLCLPLVEFYSHALYNKSLHRFIQSFLQQIPNLFMEVEGLDQTHHWQAKAADDDEDGADEEKKQSSKGQNKSSTSSEQLDLLRGLSKRVLLVYVRICSYDTPSATLMLSSTPSPSWLTPSFFTTSFSSSPLFSAGALLDLVAFYSAITPQAHQPLLTFILEQVNQRLPYAFTTGMQHAIGVIVNTLTQQVKLIHAPYVAGSNLVKKPRFIRDELKNLIRNITSLLWSLYSMCKIRPELMRLLIQLPNTKSSPASAANPPFLALLTTLYTVTPLLLLQELGVKYAQLSAQPDLMSLRRGCMKFLQLIQFRLILSSMGIKISKKSGPAKIIWVKPTQVEEKVLRSTQATTASVLPPAFTVATASEVFYHSFMLLHQTVHDDASSKDGLCYLPLSMKNLVSFNTTSTQNAFLKRFNEYFELDSICSFLLKQSVDELVGTPGFELERDRIEKMLDILHSIDAPLVKERTGWPLPKEYKAQSNPALSSIAEFDEHKGAAPPSANAPFTRSNSSKAPIDLTLQISELSDLFSNLSTDFIGACLSEYNGSTEETTKAILEEKLPQYLQGIKDKSKYRAGDQMLADKFKRPFDGLSRQSSTGSGLLDQPVDDEDEIIDKIGTSSASGGMDEDAAFEAFLKRTGRVSKDAVTASNKKNPGAVAILNSFDKADALLLANKINASLNAQYDDEYDDAFDDFESFVVDDAADEERTQKSIYDRAGDSTSGADADEPDGSSYQPTGRYQQPPPSSRPGMRGGRGGGSASNRGGRSSSRPTNYDNVVVPKSFMAERSGAVGPPLSVQDQWRKDEEIKELYIATLKAQKAQTLAPSKRSAEEQADYEHGLRYGLIQNLENPQLQPQQKGGKNANQSGPQQQSKQTHPPSSQDSRKSLQPQQQNQQQQSNRGGFSMRGGHGGNSGGGGGRGGLSANAPSFEPRSSPESQSSSSSTTQSRPTSAQPNRSNQPQQPQQGGRRNQSTPAQWDDDSVSESDEDGEGNQQPQGNQGQSDQQGGGQSQRASGGQSGQPMDLRAKKRKEKNKSMIANHNRKAGHDRKQMIKF